MAEDKDRTSTNASGEKTHIVEATDANGSVAGRDAFATEAEAEAHADRLRSEGHKVDVSTLAPKPKDLP